jgi:hypothetical protein
MEDFQLFTNAALVYQPSMGVSEKQFPITDYLLQQLQ